MIPYAAVVMRTAVIGADDRVNRGHSASWVSVRIAGTASTTRAEAATAGGMPAGQGGEGGATEGGLSTFDAAVG